MTTVIMQTALLPSTVAVITVAPSLTAVTLPFLSTVANSGLLEAQFTVLSEAFSGLIDALSVISSSTSKVKASLFKVISVTVVLQADRISAPHSTTSINITVKNFVLFFIS